MVFRGEQGANVALKHEVRLARALDSLCYLRVGLVDRGAHLAANILLPRRNGLDVGINSWIGHMFHGFRLRCHCEYLSFRKSAHNTCYSLLRLIEHGETWYPV